MQSTILCWSTYRNSIGYRYNLWSIHTFSFLSSSASSLTFSIAMSSFNTEHTHSKTHFINIHIFVSWKGLQKYLVRPAMHNTDVYKQLVKNWYALLKRLNMTNLKAFNFFTAPVHSAATEQSINVYFFLPIFNTTVLLTPLVRQEHTTS